MHKLIPRQGEHRAHLSPRTQSRWMTRGRYHVIGGSLATVIAAAGLYYARPHVDPGNEILHEADRSAAYQFGFANAALAGCSFSPGAALDQLAAAVQADSQGIVPEEIKTGFVDFHNLLEKSGMTAACSRAEGIFGPAAQARPGVLLPR